MFAVSRQLAGGPTEISFGFWVFPEEYRSGRFFFCPVGRFLGVGVFWRKSESSTKKPDFLVRKSGFEKGVVLSDSGELAEWFLDLRGN